MNPARLISQRPSLAVAAALLESESLPTADLTEPLCQHFFFLGPADAPAGLVGLELRGDVALLRSLVVKSEGRGSGTGTALVVHAEDYARAHAVRHLYLLTTSAEDFFRKRGYTNASRDTAPAAIRETREFSGICPASSAFMTKQL